MHPSPVGFSIKRNRKQVMFGDFAFSFSGRWEQIGKICLEKNKEFITGQHALWT